MNSNYHINLRVERLKRKWTQKEAAEKIGISRSYYSDIENGRKLPSGEMLFTINDILPVLQLINETEVPKWANASQEDFI